MDDKYEVKEKWRNITIAKDIGFSEESINLLDTKLAAVNRELPAGPGGALGDRFSSDEMAEQILRQIAKASAHHMNEANTELNAVWKVCPGNRVCEGSNWQDHRVLPSLS